MSGRDIYNQIVGIAHDYLGPAAPRYVDRLIESHLNKEPSALREADLPELTQWIIRTTAMLTDDEQEIATFQERLMKLHGNTAKGSS